MVTKETAYATIRDLVNRFEEQFASYKKADYNETLVRRDFIDPFFTALGWDIDNSQGNAEAYREVIHEDKIKIGGATKAPDYSFRLSGGKRLFFVEAKKPSIAIKDQPEPAYQIRRYAWSAKMPVSILTDFEEFAVYDCNKKPSVLDKASVARIKYITYQEYLKEFDFLWNTFSKEKVLKGSFDNFIQNDTYKKGTTTVDKEFLQSLDEWRTLIAIDICKNNKSLDEDEINFVVQQSIDRIIFLRIAEDRSIELYGQLKDCIKRNNYYTNLFHLFEEADKKYNSGLFDFKKDRISKQLIIDNKVIKTIINELYYPQSPYEFSVLSVEILGNAYEQFLGKQIKIDKAHKARIEEKPEVRKAGGVYYTPQFIVEYIVEKTIGKLVQNKVPNDISKIKIVDPACGSGSFLLGVYQYLMIWYRNFYMPEFKKLSSIAQNSKDYNEKQRNEAVKERNKLPLTPDGNLTTAIKKEILKNNIYGVDIDVNAVEVTKLSLLLKCMEGETQSSINAEMRFGERVLPTLDNNIKDGNSLIDVDFYKSVLDFGEEKKVKPFSWQKNFPDIFKLGGFDILIGNPPYVFGRDWKALGITEDVRIYLGAKFGSSSYQLDMFSIFMEQAFNLIKDKGMCSFIVPNVWLNNSYSSSTRKFILENSQRLEISVPKKKVFGGITVDTIIYVCQRGKGKPNNEITILKLDKEIAETFMTLKFEKYLSGQEPISTSISGRESSIIKKILEAGEPLSKHAEITRGIHPYRIGGYGQSAFAKGPQIQKDVDERPYHSSSRLPHYRPFVYGKDLKRFTPVISREYIKYGKWLAEPRDPKYFEGNRIFSRKILGDKLVVTIEKDETVADQQVYVTLPKSKDIDIEYLAAIMGSKLMGFFIKKYFNEGDDDFPQIKVGQLKSLPIFQINKKNATHIELRNSIVEFTKTLLNLNLELGNLKLQSKIEQINSRIEYCEEKIQQAIYHLYGLTNEEIIVVDAVD